MRGRGKRKWKMRKNECESMNRKVWKKERKRKRTEGVSERERVEVRVAETKVPRGRK